MRLPEPGGKLRATRITLVIGTRPEAIKLAPVARALLAQELEPRILLTGQHANLDVASHDLGRFLPTRLACPGVDNPFVHAARVARAAAPAMRGIDLVIVQGDTSSALGGTRAAARAGVPVAHVEAGLRSHDPRRPWPEEKFRVVIDRDAHLLFAPTDLSAANLRRERVTGAIHVTGNTGIDALLSILADMPRASPSRGGAARLLVTCHRRESWGDGLASIAAALTEISLSRLAEVIFVLHPNGHVALEMRRRLDGISGIALHPPCGHREMVALMRRADLILSDSGGMQEEAPVLGVPLLVLRDATERPEAIATGNIALVGTNSATIVASVRRLLSNRALLAAMARPAFPYGDGTAAERIADIVAEWAGCAKASAAA